MASTHAAAPYTWDDFIALDEDDLRELIDGELVEVEVPTDTHEYIVTRLCSALTVWSDAGHGGRALASGYKVRVSESQRHDRVTKLRWYAQLGVPEYWVIDPQARTFERLVLRERSYVIADSLAEDETFRPDRFEGFEIPLAKLWT